MAEGLTTKRDVRRWQRENRKQRWARRRREWRCFWTWPLGHAYLDHQCVECGAGQPLNY